MICFETERMQVCHLTPDDIEDLYALCSDPLAMQYMGDGELLTHEQCVEWIDICQKKYRERGYGTSGVYDKTTGEFMGFCGVVRAPDNDFDEIIYALNQPYWGRGYATEVARGMLDYVFEVSELDEIYATIHENNLISQKMMPKLGMTFVEDRLEDDNTITKVYVIKRPTA